MNVSLYAMFGAMGFGISALIGLFALEVFDIDAFDRKAKIVPALLGIAAICLLTSYVFMLPSIFK